MSNDSLNYTDMSEYPEISEISEAVAHDTFYINLYYRLRKDGLPHTAAKTEVLTK